MEQLTDTEIRELRELLGKFRQLPVVGVRGRPAFRRETTITVTARIGKELHKEAVALAKERKDISGGTLNGLIEFLLWRELGSNDKYLKTEDPD